MLVHESHHLALHCPVSMTDRGRTHDWDAADRVVGILQALVLLWTMVGVMAAVDVCNVLDGYRLDNAGIEARSPAWLWSIFTSPFVHDGVAHFVANAIPLVVLGSLVAMLGVRRFALVTAVVVVVGGLGVWLTASGGKPTVGASGVVLGYASFLIVRGVFFSSIAEAAAAALVCAIWGGALLQSVVPRSGVSWQAHVWGAVGGLLAEWWIRRASTSPRGSASVRAVAVHRALGTRETKDAVRAGNAGTNRVYEDLPSSNPCAIALMRQDIRTARLFLSRSLSDHQ